MMPASALLWTGLALWRHYLRHPLQLMLLLVGACSGVVMIVGVQLLNQQAKDSYQEGEQLLGLQPAAYLQAEFGQSPLPQSAYIWLRRQGFDSLVPILQGSLALADGQIVTLIGSDPLSSFHHQSANDAARDTSRGNQLDIGSFTLPPYQILVSRERAKQLGWQDNSDVYSADGRKLAQWQAADEQALGHQLWVDIGYAQQLLGQPQQLSQIAVLDDEQAGRLSELLPELNQRFLFGGKWQLSYPSSPLALEQMAQPLHLNLRALGLLSWLVGCFIVFNAISFALQDRRRLLHQLFQAGVTRQRLAALLITEQVLLCAMVIILSAPLSWLLAEQLLPALGRSLAQIYAINIDYRFAWRSDIVLYSAIASGCAFLLAALFPLRSAIKQIARRPAAELAPLRGQRPEVFAGIALLVLCVALDLLGRYTEWALPLGYLTLALLLLGSGLVVPALLVGLLKRLPSRLASRLPLQHWSLGELGWQLSRSKLALLALVLALTANVGLNTMVGSFRQAVSAWLDQRLVADIYLRPEQAQPPWLSKLQQQDVTLISRRSVSLDFGLQGLEVVALDRHPRLQDSILDTPLSEQQRQLLESGQGLLINQRLQLLAGVAVGDNLSVDGKHYQVLAVYADYGNPRFQVFLDIEVFAQRWPGARDEGIALMLDEPSERADWLRRLVDEYGLSPTQIIDQQQIRSIALKVFEQTFVATSALNLLTLLIAALGLACNLLLLAQRRRYGLALLHSMGVQQSSLKRVNLAHWGLLGAVSCLLALPLGIGLAWLLIKRLNVYGFGWDYPLVLASSNYLQMVLLSAAVCVLCAWLAQKRIHWQNLPNELGSGN
ncbi:ABC transporter permease [Aliagarivorans taiwanensis]|uniref:ABC transporter permease n=1 Tax=Aliagarivorans taiwanensis TaxID=561966 RepID=UPI00047D5200|nr:ABC transporter permease [Aliagarivorans taiwanensis]